MVAIFPIPMRMGVVTGGVVTLYRDAPGDLDENHQLSTLGIASAIARAAVQWVMNFATSDAVCESVVVMALCWEVHQATRMILVQLDTTATTASSRLQGYAFAQGRMSNLWPMML